MRRALLSFFLPTVFCCAVSIPLFSQTVDSLDRPALTAHAPQHSVLLDVAMAGNRIVAVGERGVIVLSDDRGRSWRQASVPVSVSLTKVMFATPKAGWCVGHSGVVLHTQDGGQTWTRQLDGITAAKLALDAAQAAADHAGPGNAAVQHALTDAQRLVSDGPDKPFLDLYFENEKSGYVVGAYGLIFRTEDGGVTWKPLMDRVDNPRGMHIYAIAAQGKNIYLAGEQGLFLHSSDSGNKFAHVDTPYKGTFFTLTVLPTSEVILSGMRGNAFRSTNHGKSFTEIDVPIPVSFSASVLTASGVSIFANQAGMLLSSTDKGQTMRPVAAPGLPPISGLADIGHGMLMTVGFGGAIPVPLSVMSATTTSGGVH